MPSAVSPNQSFFDRFASKANAFTARATFFSACLALVLLWIPTYFLVTDVDTWQLIINTTTTIITFLLVALIQNAQMRADAAAQRKLNAIAAGLADLMAALATEHPDLRLDIYELREAVGLEERESA